MSYSRQLVHWRPSDSKTPPISRTLLSILADLNNADVGIVSIRFLISNFSNPLPKPLETVPSESIIIGIIVTLIIFTNPFTRALNF